MKNRLKRASKRDLFEWIDLTFKFISIIIAFKFFVFFVVSCVAFWAYLSLLPQFSSLSTDIAIMLNRQALWIMLLTVVSVYWIFKILYKLKKEVK